MANKKYSKAPVSEVIFGINFNMLVLSREVLFSIYSLLKNDFPTIEILVPMADEKLVGFQIMTGIDPALTGELLLRLKSKDLKWLVQLQGNKIYLNWVRLDTEDIGHYPGYTAIKNKFEEVIKLMGTNLAINLTENVNYYELTYHDRVEWEKLIKNMNEVDKILNYIPPKLTTPIGLNNLFSKFTYSDETVGGYGLVGFNTATSQTNKQVLRVENTIRGFLPDVDRDKWFGIAHQKHEKHFTEIFTEKILNSWS